MDTPFNVDVDGVAAKYCTARGEGLEYAVAGEAGEFQIVTTNRNGRKVDVGTHALFCMAIVSTEGRLS